MKNAIPDIYSSYRMRYIGCRMRQLSNGLSQVVSPSRDMNVACGNLVPRGISKVMCSNFAVLRAAVFEPETLEFPAYIYTSFTHQKAR